MARDKILSLMFSSSQFSCFGCIDPCCSKPGPQHRADPESQHKSGSRDPTPAGDETEIQCKRRSRGSRQEQNWVSLHPGAEPKGSVPDSSVLCLPSTETLDALSNDQLCCIIAVQLHVFRARGARPWGSGLPPDERLRQLGLGE